MASMRLCAAALLLLACCCWQSALGRPQPPQQKLLRLRRSSHYCGSHLAAMMELVCGVGGVSGRKRASVDSKHTATGNMADYSGDRRPNELNDLVQALQYPSYSDRPRLLQSVDPLGGRRRESRSVPAGGPDRVRVKRQGIVEECCFNSCSITTLRSYCNS